MQRELPDDDYLQLLARDEPVFRDQLLGWLRANGIKPEHVPAGERPSLVDGVLTLRMFTLSASGRQQTDPLDDTRCLTHTVTVPMTVEPDAQVARWLTPPCPTCGR
jgi:hypothetical protein